MHYTAGFMKTLPNNYVWDRQKQTEIGGKKLMQYFRYVVGKVVSRKNQKKRPNGSVIYLYHKTLKN